MNFFSADLHFSHERIIKYCDRPFKDKNEMNSTLIRKHNSLITNSDTVYYIGDFAFVQQPHQLEAILNKLNGRKILILGNHDEMKPFTYVNCGFESVHSSLLLTLSDGNEYILNHDPCIACNPNEKRRYLCGHVHNIFKDIDNGRIVNVGVDAWNFYPVREEQIINYAKL